MKRRAAALVLAALTLPGCAVQYGKVPHSAYVASPRCMPTGTEAAPDAAALPLFFVTSRLPDCRRDAVQMLSHRGDRVRFGRFAGPMKVDGKTPVPLALMADTLWWQELAAAGAPAKGRVLLYVHGYRESFASVARDTAQIGRMTGFDGPVIAYSWPSQGKAIAYATDETNMYWDQLNFQRFLKTLAEQPWATDITIVSHSLGARLVLPAIEHVDDSTDAKDARNISNIILQAPDIDREDFEREVKNQLLTESKIMRDRRIHIYVSVSDRALAISRQVHGYPRLGSPYCFNPDDPTALRLPDLRPRCYPGTGGIFDRPDRAGLVIIDTTDVTRGTSGHSNFLQSAEACRDFIAVVGGAMTGPRRTPVPGLAHVFRLTDNPTEPKPDHDAVCARVR
jgi:pimeloyl-ACP methyl ester carboxylesterase